MVEIEITHIRHLGDPKTRGHGIVKGDVVLFGDGQPHFVHVPVLPVATLLPGADAPGDPSAKDTAVECNSRPDQFFLKKRREVALVKEERTEATFVSTHQPMGQRRTASSVAHHEDRRFDLDPPEPGEQNAVEKKTEGVKGRYQGNRDAENRQEVETRFRIFLVPRQIHHFSVIRKIEKKYQAVASMSASMKASPRIFFPSRLRTLRPTAWTMSRLYVTFPT